MSSSSLFPFLLHVVDNFCHQKRKETRDLEKKRKKKYVYTMTIGWYMQHVVRQQASSRYTQHKRTNDQHLNKINELFWDLFLVVVVINSFLFQLYFVFSFALSYLSVVIIPFCISCLLLLLCARRFATGTKHYICILL